MNRTVLEAIGFAALFGAIIYAWIGLAPSAPLPSYVTNPAYFAFAAATLWAAAYLVLRLWPSRHEVLERLLLATFLAAMPLIYLWAVLVSPDRGPTLVELCGVGIYGGLALFGFLRKSYVVLALGIAAHGVAWDAWHHHHADYLEPWYPLGCLVVDLAFGFLVGVQHFGLNRPIRQHA